MYLFTIAVHGVTVSKIDAMTPEEAASKYLATLKEKEMHCFTVHNLLFRPRVITVAMF